MPGVLIVEALAQSCGLLTCLTSEDQKNQVYLLTGVNNAKFREMVRPGDQLVFDVEFIQARRTAAKFSAKASVDGKLVCSAEINCVSKPPEGGESAPAKK